MKSKIVLVQYQSCYQQLKRYLPALFTLFLCLIAMQNFAQAVKPALTQLSERSWALVAQDDITSNSALFVGDHSALIVDPGFTPSDVAHFLKEVKKVTDRKVRWAILSHWHPDHAMGIVCQAFPGIILVAHPKTRRLLIEQLPRLKQSLASRASDPTDQAVLAKCPLSLPEQMIAKERIFDLGGHQVKVFATAQAHTAGDLVTYSLADQTMVTGDLFLRDSATSTRGGDLLKLIQVLDELALMKPRVIVPGHFAISTTEDLLNFTHYLKAQVSHAKEAIDKGHSLEKSVAGAKFPEYEYFLEFPQYQATRKDNARAAYVQLKSQPPETKLTLGYELIKVLDVGRAPHQIEFSHDNERAYIAAAGSDKITVVNTHSLKLEKQLAVDKVPLGVKHIKANDSLIVARFRSDSIVNIDAQSGQGISPPLFTGVGASLIHGPVLHSNLSQESYLIPVEEANKVWQVSANPFTLLKSFEVGRRPFPVATTDDGRLAFVPNYDDGTVTVIDLWNDKIVSTVAVGVKPSGGVVLPGGNVYAVVVRGENTLKLINTSSFKVTGEISQGIGESPFSIVLAPDGQRAYVNNTGSDDVSVIDLPSLRVIARLPVGNLPIVMAVDPTGTTLWVACEGSHDLYILKIPQAKAKQAAKVAEKPTEVAVLGMIHGEHTSSQSWGVKQVSQIIRQLKPDVVCVEIPPNRWQRIWQDWTEKGQINERRVQYFPEYTEVLLPLSWQLSFEIVPCAGWTQEMASLRQARVKSFASDPAHAKANAQYQQAQQQAKLKAEQVQQAQSDDPHDPLFIHSNSYDQSMKQQLQPYDHYLNDYIGPGGWTHINQAHYALIEQTINQHQGKRILITFGAGHKYWFLQQLRKRQDIKLMDISPFIKELSTMTQLNTAFDENIKNEILQLHQFFQDWFSGAIAKTDQTFQRFEGALTKDFSIVGPSGRLSYKAELLPGLKQLHATYKKHPFHIEIKNIQHRQLSEDLYLASYEEWQRYGDSYKGRISSAIFKVTVNAVNNLQWASVHETWLQGD